MKVTKEAWRNAEELEGYRKRDCQIDEFEAA
jgi:hypothetical protein